ncbi:MAG: hypothetical protein ACYTF3_09025 [Planctomycetota bacterium]|jgi:hypothetical protein
MEAKRLVMVVGGAAVAALAVWLLDPFGGAPPAVDLEEDAVLEEAPAPPRDGLAVRVRDAEDAAAADFELYLGNAFAATREEGQGGFASLPSTTRDAEGRPLLVAARSAGSWSAGTPLPQDGPEGEAAEDLILVTTTPAADLTLRFSIEGMGEVVEPWVRIEARGEDGLADAARLLLANLTDGTQLRHGSGAEFSLNGLPPGTYHLQVGHAGCPPMDLDLRLDPGQALELPVTLEAGAELRGRLVDAAGDPVVAASLGLLPVEPAGEETSAWLDPLAEFQLYGVFPPGTREDGTVSDAAGSFRVGNLPSGDWHLLVTAEGMRPFSRLLPRPLEPAMELDLEEMELARGLELALAVRDEDGAPVEGAEVRWRRRPQEGVLASPVSSRPRATDAVGSLALTGLPPGGLLVEVRHPSYAVATLPAQAAAPAAALPVVLSPAHAFDGLCLAADGDLPVAHAYLKLMPVRGEAAAVGLCAGSFDSEARSGEDGAFRFDALPPGDYFLIATHPDFATTTSEVFRVDGTRVTPYVLRLCPGATLEVQLLDDEGMPAPQAWVLVQGERDESFQRARSDDRGIARFERLPAGTYRAMRAEAVPIATSRHGRLHRDYEFVALREDERRELVLGGRELLTRLEGYVVEGGRARPGRRVALLADDGVRSAVSDAAGFYSIGDLVPGSYLFQVSVPADGNPAAGSFFGTVALQDAESNKRDIVLPLAAIEVHVVDDASGRELEHVPVSLRPADGTELAVGAFASTDGRGLALFDRRRRRRPALPER